MKWIATTGRYKLRTVPEPGITPKLFNQVAQLGHFAGGAALVLATVVLWRDAHAPFAGFAGVCLAVALKEFWYDYKYESTEVRGSSAEDFSFYLLGAGAAAIVALVRGRL
jgi:hypothetical protein